MGNQNSGKPMISVIMGIYNCADTLPEAIDSILKQTLTDWELILCDDGSVDNTYLTAKTYRDQYPEKIVLLKNKKNRGLNYTLNRCLRKARGQYVARMDGDDLCVPERFEKELYVLKNEPEIAIVSSSMGFFDEFGIWGNVSHKEYPQPEDFVHGTPFCHAPCMVKKEAYEAVNGYSISKYLLRVEDYHLWIKMYKTGFRGKNLQEQLYLMRDDRAAYNRRKFKYRLNEAYVTTLAVRELHLPATGYLYVLRPVVVGMLPDFIYNRLHKKRLNKTQKL